LKIIHLFPHTPNLGDEFVRIGIHKLLTEFIPDLQYETLPTSTKIAGMPASIGGITEKTIEVLNRHDLIVIGGSNLYETIATDQFEVELNALEQIDPPILLIGIGSGWSFSHPQFPFLSEENRKKIELLHSKSCGSSVRDYVTQRILYSQGIKSSVVTGCPSAIVFERQFQSESSGVVCLSSLPYRMHAERTLNPYRHLHSLSYKRKRKITNSYTALIRLLRSNNIDFHIFVTDFRDLPVAKSLASSSQIIFDTSSEALLQALQNCSVMVGYRLHACIPALSLGTAIIPVSLDGRFAGFIETYDLNELAVNPYDFCAENQILEKIELALGKHRTVWEHSITKRNMLGAVMRNFVKSSLENIP